MKNRLLHRLMLLSVLSAASNNLISCQSDDPQQGFSLSTGNSIVIGPLEAPDTTLKIVVSSQVEWTVESKPDWISISPGSARTSPVMITTVIEKNQDIEMRSGDIVFRLGDGSTHRMNCTQFSTTAFLKINGEITHNLDHSIQTRNVAFFTNTVNLRADVIPSSADWISATITPSGSQFSYACDISTLEVNQTGRLRSAKIVLYGESHEGYLTDTIYVNQNYYTEILPAELTNDASGFRLSWTRSESPVITFYQLKITDDKASPTILATYDVSLLSSCLLDTMAFIRNNTYFGGILLSLEGKASSGEEIALATIAPLSSSSHFAAGTGNDPDNPLLINCVRHFDNISKLYSPGDPHGVMGKYYKQTENIVLPDIASGPQAAVGNNIRIVGSKSAPFLGTYDGNGKTISNVIIISDTAFVGLFGQVGSSTVNATVKNLDVYVKYVEGRGIGSDAKAAAIGGVVGMNQGSIIDCRVFPQTAGQSAIYGNNRHDLAAVTVSTYYGHAGGIAGANERDIIRCKNMGCAVVGRYTAGGITGGLTNAPLIGTSVKATIQYCCNLGDIYLGNPGAGKTLPMGIEIPVEEIAYAQDFTAGGIIGNCIGASANAKPSVTFCFNGGNVRSENIAGGIMGRVHFCALENCYNYGNVTLVRNYSLTNSIYAGGITGHVNNNASNTSVCYNAGILGYDDATETGTNIYLGGIAGNRGGTGVNVTLDNVVYITQPASAAGMLGTGSTTGFAATCITLTSDQMKSLGNYPSGFTTSNWSAPSGTYPYPQLVANPQP